jgi:hypothetical protein
MANASLSQRRHHLFSSLAMVIAQSDRQLCLDSFYFVEFENISPVLAGSFQPFAAANRVILKHGVSVYAHRQVGRPHCREYPIDV